MQHLKRLLLALVFGVAIVVLVVLGHTVSFTSKQRAVAPVAVSGVDAVQVAQRLGAAVRFRTVSTQDAAAFDGKPFLAFHQFLEQTFPRVHAALQREVVNTYSLLYCWPGSDPALKPILLTAHQDVVPAESEKDWTHPPFEGTVADGFVWGRGTLDDKGSLMGILEAVDALLQQGFQPRRTVYLAFGHDEEVGGSQGAPSLAEQLRSKNVRLEYVIDEGGGIAQGVVPGIQVPTAAIGLAEKGYVSLELAVEGESGHSSSPPRQTNIGILARAVTNLETHPFPADLSQVARFFGYVGPEMPFMQRMVFANLWLTAPLVKRIVSRNPSMDAAIRTTTAPTIFHAGFKENVLPDKATAIVNFRILPGNTVDGVFQRVQHVIADDRVRVTPLGNPSEPSPVSDVRAKSYATLDTTIRQIFGETGTIVAPFIVLGATDSRHYASLADNVYRFLPVILQAEDIKRIHNVNERVAVDGYARMIQFYEQLIRNSQEL